MSVGFMTVDGTNINVIVLPRVCRLQTIFSYYITNVCALNQDSNIRDCILHCKKKKAGTFQSCFCCMYFIIHAYTYFKDK